MSLEMDSRGRRGALQAGLGTAHTRVSTGPASAAALWQLDVEADVYVLVVWLGANDRPSLLPYQYSITLNQENDF